MGFMMKTSFVLVLCSVALFSVAQPNAGFIRKSTQGVCHPPESRYYAQLKHYTEFPDMPSCLASGGRALRGTRT